MRLIRQIATAALLLACPAAIAEDALPWSAEMAKFAAQDEASPSPPKGIVFVGSSSIRLWDLPKSFPGIAPAPLNRGFGGSEISDSIEHFDLLVLKHQPRVVVLYAGDNDIAGGKSPERVEADFRKFRQLLKESLPETQLAYIAIKPSILRWKLAGKMKAANDAIQKISDGDKKVTFIDVWTPMLGDDGKPRGELFRDDGLHLNDAGYALWARVVEESISLQANR